MCNASMARSVGGSSIGACRNESLTRSNVSVEEWAFVAAYLTLVRKDAPQRTHDLREVFNALRWIVRAGTSWRMLPRDLPPWEAVYQQTRRWIAAGLF
jgi:transposase